MELLYNLSLLFFCIKCAEVIIVYIKIIFFFFCECLEGTHREEERKKKNIFYYSQQSRHTFGEVVSGAVLLIENTS